ncbi:hypothetical protein KAT92_01415, partial [Candidatus Babeliales bacterium]|nr:hypothetical protein [Candidatus Babeliales bacterium]
EKQSVMGDERPDWQAIVEKALTQEDTLKEEFYVFYHGQKWQFRIVQDLLRKLSIRLRGYSQGDFSEFCYLRVPGGIFEDSNLKIMSDLFKQGEVMGESVDEDKPWFADRLLSVNLSLFGGGFSSCLAWYYFTENDTCFGYGSNIKKLLGDVFACFSIALEETLLEKYLNELLSLNETIKTKEGNLFQIFITKGEVNKYMYLSCILNSHDADKIKIVDKAFDVSRLINSYFYRPVSEVRFNDLDYFQGRILLNNYFMLNPRSGVKIFRYTTVNQKDVEKYEEKLDKLIDDISTCMSRQVFQNTDLQSPLVLER